MPENRTARNEAWIASVVVHVLVLAGLIALVGRPRELPGGPVAVATRDPGHEIGVVMLAEPPARPVTRPPTPVVVRTAPPAVPPVAHAPGPPAPPPVQTAAHREPVIRDSTPAMTPAAYAAGPPSVAPTSARSSDPPLPPGAATAFFGVPALGKSVVYVLDRSASMGLDGRLDRARRELAASLRRLPPTARFQVIVYHRTAEPVSGPPGLSRATPEAIEAAITAVMQLPAEGTSEHAKALTRALSLQPDVIFFLTDEDDLELRDVQAVTRINHGRVCIHALCLVPPAGGETPMRALARSNRGEFQAVR